MTSHKSTNEHWAQAQLAQLRSRKLMIEARGCTDPKRLDAINDEMKLIVDGLIEIREQQIMAELERNAPKPKRRWWRLGR